MKKGEVNIWIVVGAVFAILLIWGMVGGHQAQSIGVTCDFGFGGLCWKWHKNVIGDIQEAVGEIFKT